MHLEPNWPLFVGLTFHFMGQIVQHMGHLSSRRICVYSINHFQKKMTFWPNAATYDYYFSLEFMGMSPNLRPKTPASVRLAAAP